MQIAYTVLAIFLLNIFFFTEPLDVIGRRLRYLQNIKKIKPNSLIPRPSGITKVEELAHRDLRKLYKNLTIVVCGGFTTAFFHLNYFFFFVPLITTFILNLLLQREKIFEEFKLLFQKKTWYALSLAFYAYAPALVNSLRNNQVLGMNSQRNNDVGFYALVAKEFLKSGLKNSGEVENFNTTDAVLTQHQTANQLVAFTSKLFHLQPYECMNIVILFILFLTAYLLITLAQSINKRISVERATLIAGLVLCSPLVVYIDANYFLGEATAFVIELGLSLLALDFFRKRDLSSNFFYQLSLLLTLCIYTYPVFLILFFILIVIFVIAHSSGNAKKFRSASLKQFVGWIILSLLAGCFLALPYLHYAWKLVTLLSRGSFGWSIRPIDPLSIFIQTKYIDFSQPSNSLKLASWVIAIILICSLISVDRVIPKQFIVAFGIIIVLICFNTYAIGGGDWGHYQNWKLITYFMPLFLVFFYTAIVSQKRFFFKAIALSLTVLQFSVPWFSWKDMISGRIPSNVLTRDQLQVRIINSPAFKEIKDLNVAMPSWFETMAMANILINKHIYLNTNSYITPTKDLRFCTLQHKNLSDANSTIIGNRYEILKGNKGSC